MPKPFAPPAAAALSVDFGAAGTPTRNFWHSCGWCPPDPHPSFPEYFAQEDLLQNHLMIGSVPHQGIKFVRIHYLLDLIKLLGPSSSTSASNAAPRQLAKPTAEESGRLPLSLSARTKEGEDPAAHHWFKSGDGRSGYLAGVGLNFTGLDRAMDQLHLAGLFPGFEIMGNPGNEDDRSDRLFTDFSDSKQILAWKDLVHAIASRYVQRYGAETVRQVIARSWADFSLF
jgi:L-iduronidase